MGSRVKSGSPSPRVWIGGTVAGKLASAYADGSGDPATRDIVNWQASKKNKAKIKPGSLVFMGRISW
jgi:hypothetical protein